jgi:hypothetical protein
MNSCHLTKFCANPCSDPSMTMITRF